MTRRLPASAGVPGGGVMILSDDEVLHAWDDDPTWFRSKFKTSHLEANARIRELESGICHQVLAFVRAATEGRVSALAESFPVVRAVADLWHEKRCLEMRLEDCRLDAEGLGIAIREKQEANARIRELEADLDRWFRDHRILSEAFIRQCDRADQLAVIADALAGELQYIYDFWQKEEIEIAKAKGVLISKELTWCVERTDLMDRADRAEAKLRELIQDGDLNETDGCPLRRVCRVEEGKDERKNRDVRQRGSRNLPAQYRGLGG